MSIDYHFTAGVERPLILLYSGAVELLSTEELLFVIAHELGHVKSGHVLYYQIAEFLPLIDDAILHRVKAADEFFAGGGERGLGLDTELAREIHDAEKQIADLVGHGVLFARLHGFFEFGGLFFDLLEHRRGIRPQHDHRL